jgi:hypothetical protein
LPADASPPLRDLARAVTVPVGFAGAANVGAMRTRATSPQPRHVKPIGGVVRKLAMVLIAGLAAFAIAACSGHSSSSDTGGTSESSKASSTPSKSQQPEKVPGKVSEHKLVAKVNGHKITGATYNRALTQVHQQAQQQQMQQGQSGGMSKKQEKQQAVQSVVGNELLLQDANKHGFKAPKSKVDKQIHQTKKQYKTKKQLHSALKQNDLTMHQFRSQVADQVKLDSYVKHELGPFHVSSKQIKQSYNQYKQQQKQAQQQSKNGSKKQSVPSLKQLEPQLKQQLKNQQKQKKVSDQVTKLKKKGHVKVLI